MNELPHGITYAALGLVTLTMAGLVVWGVVQRLNRRSQAEGDLDTRLPLILDATLKPWQQLADLQKGIIDEERKEKQRAQDERESITKQFIQYSTEQDNLHRADMDKLRDEHRTASLHVNQRLDECNRRDAHGQALLQEAVRRIEQLESRERTAYEVTRNHSSAVPGAQLVLQQPVAPVATAAA